MKTIKYIMMLLLGVLVSVSFTACGGSDDEETGGGTNSKTPSYVEAVDLGLSVKWANVNLGAKTPYELGDYYAWGETSPKKIYSVSTYKYCDGSESSITKYNFQSENGDVDGKYKLDPEDDAATVNWGVEWRMPTYDEIKELIERCTIEPCEMYGAWGYRLTGRNGKSIFLSGGGEIYDDYNEGGSAVSYWSSTLSSNNSTRAWMIDSRYGSHIDNYHSAFGTKHRRWSGLLIRPVKSK